MAAAKSKGHSGPPGPAGTLRLHRLSAERIAVDSGQATDRCCEIVVVRGRGRAARGANVEYRIIRGPVRFEGTRRKTLSLKSDRNGRCAPHLVFTGIGKAVITARLPGNEREALAFQPYTEKLTHDLYIYPPAVIEARDGRLALTVSALDHRGNVVSDAELSVVATLGSREATTRLSFRRGVYVGAMTLRRAGCWTVSAYDRRTGAFAVAKIQVIAGRPSRLRLVADPDPRVRPPYDRALVRAVVEDSLGNRLDPRLIGCTVDGRKAPRHALVAEEAQFLLEAAAARVLEVVLTVEGVALRKRSKLLCGASWLGDPGLVLVGTRHRSPLFLTPEPKRRISRATITLRYDPEQVSYVGFEADEGLPAEVAVDHEAARLKLVVEFERPVGHREYPRGIPIGFIDWQCQGEGESCVSITATMSPDTPPWEKCTSQKRDMRESVCVNFIYNRDDARLDDLPDRIDRVRRRLNRVYNNDETIKTCCPFIDFDIHLTGYTRAQWLNRVLIPAGITTTDGSGTVDSLETVVQLGRVFVDGTTEGVRGNCINFYLVDFNPRLETNGSTRVGPAQRIPGDPDSGLAGFGTIDPDQLFADTVPHEIGHALGLDHDPPGPDTARDRDELMNEGADRRDTKIKRKDDCRIVWQNIRTY